MGIVRSNQVPASPDPTVSRCLMTCAPTHAPVPSFDPTRFSGRAGSRIGWQHTAVSSRLPHQRAPRCVRCQTLQQLYDQPTRPLAQRRDHGYGLSMGFVRGESSAVAGRGGAAMCYGVPYDPAEF